MAAHRICKFCKKEGFRVELVPVGKAGNMKCPDCGKMYKKEKK